MSSSSLPPLSTENKIDASKITGIPFETFIQPKITGYRQLTQQEVQLMNEGKALAEQCGEYIAKLRTYKDVNKTYDPPLDDLKLDQRWVSIGATDLQTGFMAVIRGIARPTTF